jgi:hypothetical protein
VISIPSLFFVGPTKEEEVVGHISQTNPHFLAVKNPVVAITASRRSRADNIRAGARFG